MITGTSLFFDRNRDRMTAQTATADRLQQQIATRKKLNDASQDPAGWQRLQGLVQAKSDAAAYGGNITLAQAVLTQTDMTLKSVQDQLQRANQLAIRANSGVLSVTDRAAIAEELDAIVADLASLAQTRDVRGQPLFDAAAGAIPIGDGVSVYANSDPAAVFGTIGATLTDFATRIRSGDGSNVPADAATALAALTGSVNAVAAQQGSVGARAARVELFAATAEDAALITESQRAGIEDADLPATIAELQKTMTILQATQASFAKLSQLSLFDYLR